MSTIQANAVVGQSGGPTSVINQSLVGVIREIRGTGHIGRILGARHGVRGIVDEQFIQLQRVPDDVLDRVANTPAAALGSTRDKPDHNYCERIFRSLEKNNVRYFFYIGGNDSAETARFLSELAKRENHDLQVFHIPKTIDNDLRVHDHTPGYGSAARFVAAAVMGDNFDTRSLPGIKVDVLMGRNAGYLAAATALSRQHDDDGPHLIYVPEAPLSEEKFLSDVESCFRRLGRCLIAVSEGVTTTDGRTWYEKMTERMERDSHGNVVLSGQGALGDYMADMIRGNLGKTLRVRADTFGYMQRSFPALCVSEVDSYEARRVGEMAVQYSAKLGAEGSVAMRRLPGPKYAVEYFLTPLDTVAKFTKPMPPEFLRDGNNVTTSFIDYASPLVGPLPKVGTFGELTD
ncbi:MAG: 6-phosphofructokinase [Tepidisphaeraceae bacterium]